MMRKILADEDIGYGKDGYYLAASGSVGWNEIYGAFAKALARRGVVDDEIVRGADGSVLEKMGKALNVPPPLVPFLIGGRYVFLHFSFCCELIAHLLILYSDARLQQCMVIKLVGKLNTLLSISWKWQMRKWTLFYGTSIEMLLSLD